MTRKEEIDILLQDVLKVHAELEQSGMPIECGIHDEGLLESAVNAPFQTFAGQDLYPDIFERAARLGYGITKNHPFRDGNKRTATHIMLLYLLVNDIDVEYQTEEMEQVILGVADSSISPKSLAEWLREHALVRG
ncbi:MAG: type II toxin-antitoxin system death-on-curing family toxin [Selenomonas sp.]|nr:type II toxin-antitoxin system death-on-curing family toxin [Veillonellaceae bacterium]MDY6268894.1 type II toxin-antitoxin system death-on-curing family toxin [Selenomonadaceae bacterium]MDY6349991.1 type II toxin-antitoxin system death-on-curing family toxin [Selenomonas sp.]